VELLRLLSFNLVVSTSCFRKYYDELQLHAASMSIPFTVASPVYQSCPSPVDVCFSTSRDIVKPSNLYQWHQRQYSSEHDGMILNHKSQMPVPSSWFPASCNSGKSNRPNVATLPSKRSMTNHLGYVAAPINQLQPWTGKPVRHAGGNMHRIPAYAGADDNINFNQGNQFHN